MIPDTLTKFVFVAAGHRGKGISAKIINEALVVAKFLGVKILYLQTENPDGGLYTNSGWSPVEQVNYCGLDVLVMENKI